MIPGLRCLCFVTCGIGCYFALQRPLSDKSLTPSLNYKPDDLALHACVFMEMSPAPTPSLAPTLILTVNMLPCPSHAPHRESGHHLQSYRRPRVVDVRASGRIPSPLGWEPSRGASARLRPASVQVGKMPPPGPWMCTVIVPPLSHISPSD